MIPGVDLMANETDPDVALYSMDDLISDIRPGFAFARYGDGEWSLVLNLPWADKNSERFTPDLCDAMRATLLDYNGVKLGMQGVDYLRKRKLFDPAQQWLVESGLADLKWHEADVMHKASARGELQKFVKAIRQYDVVLIGPEYLGALPFISKHIVIPPVYVWSHREKVFEHADALRDCVVLVSAGPLGKVLTHRLHGLGRGCCIIDTGSVLDPYCGVRSRSYMRDKKKKFKPLR